MMIIELTVIFLFVMASLFTKMARADQSLADHIVIIIIDGCRADYLTLASLPNIRSLIAQGTSYSRAWTGQLVNNTPPVHATLGTGVFPKRHGIMTFRWKDPVTSLGVEPTTLESVINGDLGQVISDEASQHYLAHLKRNIHQLRRLPLVRQSSLLQLQWVTSLSTGFYSGAGWMVSIGLRRCPIINRPSRSCKIPCSTSLRFLDHCVKMSGPSMPH